MTRRSPKILAKATKIRRTDPGCEWIGGRLTAPFWIEDRDEPYHPDIVLWMERPSGFVVGQEVVAPEDIARAVGRVLESALDRPLAGPRRRPARLRVTDAAMAAEVRALVGDSIPVTVAPAPELDEVLESLRERMEGSRDGVSYLEGGRIPPAVIARLFTVARPLYSVAPWKTAGDHQTLRMDIPALGVDGACVSIIGNLGEHLGFLVFPFLAGYEAFGRAADRRRRAAARFDAGTDWLALTFERGADLSATRRREVAMHGWPVAGPGAHPVVTSHGRDGAPRPLEEQDVRIATACAASLTAFFVKHRGVFEAEKFEPICESWFDEDDLEVRFTIPYEAFELFEIEPAPLARPAPAARPKAQRPGRNDPCPCGSGRKYKQCHLRIDQEEASARSPVQHLHDLDGRLVHDLTVFAMRRFGEAWRRFEEDFADAEDSAQLSRAWSVCHCRIAGATVLERYLEEKGPRLSTLERAWLSAQRAAWLSVWEVLAVEPGKTVTLHDLLSGEERRVIESGGSRTLVSRDAILARVVDHEGVSVLCGTHPRPLPPREAAEVVRLVRAGLRWKGPVPSESLRDDASGRVLIRFWEEAVASLDRRPALPRELQNTDGDPLLLTTDHFDIAPGEGSEIEAALAALPGVQPPESGEDPAVYVFMRTGNPRHRHWDHTIVGHARVSGTRLRVETNSLRRADSLRAQIESACGDRIRHRLREHTDPLSEKARSEFSEKTSRGRDRRDAEPTIPPAEAAHVVREIMTRHYTEWLDSPIPALEGKTPRQAVRTAKGRAAVDLLLKEIENREQRRPDGAAFDVSWLRRELRL